MNYSLEWNSNNEKKHFPKRFFSAFHVNCERFFCWSWSFKSFKSQILRTLFESSDELSIIFCFKKWPQYLEWLRLSTTSFNFIIKLNCSDFSPTSCSLLIHLTATKACQQSKFNIQRRQIWNCSTLTEDTNWLPVFEWIVPIKTNPNNTTTRHDQWIIQQWSLYSVVMSVVWPHCANYRIMHVSLSLFEHNFSS